MSSSVGRVEGKREGGQCELGTLDADAGAKIVGDIC